MRMFWRSFHFWSLKRKSLKKSEVFWSLGHWKHFCLDELVISSTDKVFSIAWRNLANLFFQILGSHRSRAAAANDRETRRAGERGENQTGEGEGETRERREGAREAGTRKKTEWGEGGAGASTCSPHGTAHPRPAQGTETISHQGGYYLIHQFFIICLFMYLFIPQRSKFL